MVCSTGEVEGLDWQICQKRIAVHWQIPAGETCTTPVSATADSNQLHLSLIELLSPPFLTKSMPGILKFSVHTGKILYKSAF